MLGLWWQFQTEQPVMTLFVAFEKEFFYVVFVSQIATFPNI